MSIVYTLKDPQGSIPVKEQKVTPIICIYHFDGMRLKLGIGESILPKDWNPAKHRSRANAPESASLTKYMDRLEGKIREIYLQMKSDFQVITPESLRQAINRDLKNGGKKETLMQFFELFIEERKKTNCKTIGVFNSVYGNLKKYTGAKNFNDITPEWFARYQTWMENHRSEEIPNGYSANYIGKNITIIREIMNLSRKAGLHRNEQYKNLDYKKPSEKVDSIYLTVDELMLMYNCDDKLTPSEIRVRDRFLIGAFSGLRFSDSATITAENIRNGLMFNRNIKTGTSVVIPVHKIIKDIMAKYPEGLPPGLSNQKSNDALKVIGDKAGIKTPVVRNQVRGGKVITTSLPKFNFITTHCGRRSFCTNAVLAGIPDQAVMLISGHKTAVSFQKYLKMTQEDSAISIKDHPFFQ